MLLFGENCFFFKLDGMWMLALEGGVLRRMVKKLSFDVLQGYRPVYFMGYRVQHLFPSFLPRI